MDHGKEIAPQIKSLYLEDFRGAIVIYLMLR